MASNGLLVKVNNNSESFSAKDFIHAFILIVVITLKAKSITCNLIDINAATTNYAPLSFLLLLRSQNSFNVADYRIVSIEFFYKCKLIEGES